MSVFTPVVDLKLGEIGNSADSERSLVFALGTRKDFGDGKIGILVRANGVIADGGLAAVEPAWDAVALTTAIVNGYSVSKRESLIVGFMQGGGTAFADNEFGWLLISKGNSSDTDGSALADAAITASAQIATHTVAGEITDIAATGSFDLKGVEVVTDPAGGGTFSTLWWDNIRFDPTANA